MSVEDKLMWLERTTYDSDTDGLVAEILGATERVEDPFELEEWIEGYTELYDRYQRAADACREAIAITEDKLSQLSNN